MSRPRSYRDIADNATDFLVMGGYGHSRLLEFVLGGVTRNLMASTDRADA